MSNWQPIETAPMDGTIVDLWVKHHGRRTSCAYEDITHRVLMTPKKVFGWRDTIKNLLVRDEDVTHWMPFPEAPKD